MFNFFVIALFVPIDRSSRKPASARGVDAGHTIIYSLCIKNKVTLSPAEPFPSWPGIV